MENIKFEVSDLDLRRIQTDLDQLESALESATSNLAADLETIWRKQAGLSGAIDSGEYVSSIELHRQNRPSAKEFLIENSSGYSAVVEMGRRDQPRRDALYIVARTLERADAEDLIKRHIDDELDKILKK